jgi:hypothetical protein
MSVTLREFRDRLNALHHICEFELVDAGVIEQVDWGSWLRFTANPVKFFREADDQVLANLWALIDRQCTASAT